MEKFAKTIYRFRWGIIITVFILTALAGFQVKNLKINSDIISTLPDDDPHASLLKDVGEKFGGNKIGMVILETDDIFKTEVLEHVRQITEMIGLMDGISSVTSLTNILDIRSGEDGLEVGKLIDEYDIPETEEALEELKNKTLSSDLYKGVIVSEDATATIIIFTLLEDADVESVAQAVIEKTTALELPENIYYAGSPMLVTAISDLIAADLIRLIPISFVVIALVLFLGFRSKRGVILPLLTSAVAIIWTMGLMAMAGYHMTMISNNIPILLLAIGSAYAIHVLNRIAQVRESEPERVLIIALTYILPPVALAAVTTMIGFVSFIFGAYLTMIRDFGLFTALGTMFSAILSLVFIPAVVAVLQKKKTNPSINPYKEKRSYLSEFILAPLRILLFKHPWYLFSAWMLLILISAGGIFLIKRNVNIQDYFRPGNPARIAEQIMEKKFGGTKPIFVVFTGDMQNPEVLNTMLRTQEHMQKSPDVLTTQSVADLIVQLSAGLGEGENIPDDQDKIEQLWFLIDGNEMLDRLVTEDLTEGIIISKFISSDDKVKEAFGVYMEKFISENSTEECKIRITGMPFIDVTMSTSLLRSQVGSLSIAIVFVIIIVGLIIRSLFRGLLATIPMVAAIIILFGFMGFAGIPLNIATVLVASVVLGIGIDYSIHVMSNFNFWINFGEDIHKAIEDTIMISGKAIVINVISVTAGFLVLLFSEMVPLQYFGLLIGFSMLASGLAALTLLPVILILINRKHTFQKR
ncbi:MAG: MMPL family transporter [Bacteroidales bacterium]|nr:MMPL family transporter [Bacteroidales bacterium]